MNPQLLNPEIADQASRARQVIRRGGQVQAAAAVATSPMLRAVIDIATAGDNLIIPGTSGLSIRIYELSLWNTAEQDVALLEGAELLSGPLVSFPDTTGYLLSMVSKDAEPHFELRAGLDFIINLSAGNRVTGHIRYKQG